MATGLPVLATVHGFILLGSHSTFTLIHRTQGVCNWKLAGEENLVYIMACYVLMYNASKHCTTVGRLRYSSVQQQQKSEYCCTDHIDVPLHVACKSNKLKHCCNWQRCCAERWHRNTALHTRQAVWLVFCGKCARTMLPSLLTAGRTC